MRIPDPIERGEARAEAWTDEMIANAPPGCLRCACGRIAPEGEFCEISADPYARPFCGHCQREAWGEAAP